MHRRISCRRPFESAPEFRRPGVEPTAITAGTARYSASPKQLVPEVELAAAVECVEDVVVEKFLDRGIELLDGLIHHAGEHGRDE